MNIQERTTAAGVPTQPGEQSPEGTDRDLTFFRGVPQVEVRSQGHTVRVPCFYYDVTHFSVGFLAPLKALEALLPSPEIQLLRVTPKRGLLHIGVFEYRDTDVGPYNEVAVSVAALPGTRARVGTGLLKAMREGPTAYVWQLPVTTEIARHLGVEFYGFPKFLADITIRHGEGLGRCRLAADGQVIFDLRAELPEPQAANRYYYHTLSMSEGRIVRAEVSMNLRARGTSQARNDVEIEFGDHPIGGRLADLGIGRPLEVSYIPSMQTILTSPVEGFPA